LVGMIMAFIISLWFIHSFRKGSAPKILATIVLICVAIFLYFSIETDPVKIAKGTHYKSYISQLIFYSKNFKWILLAFILVVMACFTFFLSTLNAHRANSWFKRLQLVSSAAFSIGHGGNDAQKVMGIITAALIAGGNITEFHQMPVWVPLACYTAIAAGTMSGGWKIIKTMGTRITKVTPFEGVAAETAGAITLFVTEALKIPVSTTHTITGSIIGVGATKRLSAVRWGVTVNLLWAWILTIPVSGALAALVYFIVHLFL
jgi:inorganic phosphate transporter, PiT family